MIRSVQRRVPIKCFNHPSQEPFSDGEHGKSIDQQQVRSETMRMSDLGPDSETGIVCGTGGPRGRGELDCLSKFRTVGDEVRPIGRAVSSRWVCTGCRKPIGHDDRFGVEVRPLGWRYPLRMALFIWVHHVVGRGHTQIVGCTTRGRAPTHHVHDELLAGELPCKEMQ